MFFSAIGGGRDINTSGVSRRGSPSSSGIGLPHTPPEGGHRHRLSTQPGLRRRRTRICSGSNPHLHTNVKGRRTRPMCKHFHTCMLCRRTRICSGSNRSTTGRSTVSCRGRCVESVRVWNGQGMNFRPGTCCQPGLCGKCQVWMNDADCPHLDFPQGSWTEAAVGLLARLCQQEHMLQRQV